MSGPRGATRTEPATRLNELLDLEAQAARAVDVDTLLSIQDEKAALLDEIAAHPPAPEICRALATRAGENLPLLRQLVSLYRGLLGPEAPLYGPHGSPLAISGPRRVTGTL